MVAANRFQVDRDSLLVGRRIVFGNSVPCLQHGTVCDRENLRPIGAPVAVVGRVATKSLSVLSDPDPELADVRESLRGHIARNPNRPARALLLHLMDTRLTEP